MLMHGKRVPDHVAERASAAAARRTSATTGPAAPLLASSPDQPLPASVGERRDALGSVLARAVEQRGAAAMHESEGAPCVAKPRSPLTRIAGGRAPLQRLVGFEAEFSVPSLPAPPAVQDLAFVNQRRRTRGGAPPSPIVEGFLRGGLPYGGSGPLGVMSPHFQLKADHDDLQDKHTDLRWALLERGYELPARDQSMSNLEYVTPAEDELAPNSTTTIRGHLDAVVAHAQGAFATARSQMLALGAPAAGAFSGFPDADFRSWLGDDYFDARIGAAITAFRNATRNEFALQATVGIIPSALPALFATRVPVGNARNVFEHAALRVRTTIEDLTSRRRFFADPWIAALARDQPMSYQAFVGLLHLAYSYMIGDALNQTNVIDGETPKNAVPFLSKLDDLGLAKHAAVPPHLRNAHVPREVIDMIEDFLWDTDYVRARYWIDNWQLRRRSQTRSDVIGDRRNFVYDMLRGRVVDAVGSPRSFGAPDTMPQAVRDASDDQQGIQLEYRDIPGRPDTNGLVTALMPIVQEVRDLNTRDMDANDRNQLLTAADQ